MHLYLFILFVMSEPDIFCLKQMIDLSIEWLIG